jgi:cytochrome c biogenesis protein CcmG, thiol:disulfide interchange protein DsbE
VAFAVAGDPTSAPEAQATTSTDPDAFDLPPLDPSTTPLRLADFAGRPLVVSFFASWCVNCEREAPRFLAVDDELGGQVAFAGVNARETGDGAAFARDLGYDRWPLGRDVGGAQGDALLVALGGLSLPTTAFYTADGEVARVTFGELSEECLRAGIAAAGVDTGVDPDAC